MKSEEEVKKMIDSLCQELKGDTTQEEEKSIRSKLSLCFWFLGD